MAAPSPLGDIFADLAHQGGFFVLLGNPAELRLSAILAGDGLTFKSQFPQLLV